MYERKTLGSTAARYIWYIKSTIFNQSPVIYPPLPQSKRTKRFPLPNMGAFTTLLLSVWCCRQLSYWLLTVVMLWNNLMCTRLKTCDNINVIVTSSDFSDYTTHQTATITKACNNYIKIVMILFRLQRICLWLWNHLKSWLMYGQH